MPSPLERTPEEWHDWEASNLERDLQRKVPGLGWTVLRMVDKARALPEGEAAITPVLDVLMSWPVQHIEARLKIDRVVGHQARFPLWQAVWQMADGYLRGYMEEHHFAWINERMNEIRPRAGR